MTREEAISVIENEIQIDVRLCTGEQVDRFQTALYMAISALRAEPTGDSLTLEQLREMDGQPVLLVFDFELEPMIALIEYVEAADCIILTNNLGGRSEFYSDEELRESEIKVYAYPPAHIDREAWTAEWKRTYKSGIHAGNGYVCSNCDTWNNRPSWFCPSCGRAMTPEAWAELEKRMGVMG